MIFSVKEITPQTAAKCDLYYIKHNCIATVSKKWDIILNHSYAINIRGFYVENELGNVVGVVQFYVSKKRDRCLNGISQSFIADNSDIAQMLFDELKRYLIRYSIRCFRLIGNSIQHQLPCVVSQKLTLQIDLTVDIKLLWKSLRDKTRNSIRKGIKNNLILKTGHDLLNDFYSIYSNRMISKKVAYHNLRFFKELIAHFDQGCEVKVAYMENCPIAAIIVLYYGNTAFYAFSGMVNGYEKICPIHSLLWDTIEKCYEKNICLLDMGESSKGSGTYNFKIWFGASPKVVNYYYYENSPPSFPLRALNSIGNRINSYLINKSPLLIKQKILISNKIKGNVI